MSRETILIVDDEPSITTSLSFCLRQEGYEVLVAENGLDAVKRVMESVPDLIISDITMPEVDGYEFCRRIREYYRTKSIPFIFLTARSTDENKLKAVRMGGDDYMTKPFDLPRLVVKIRQTLEARLAPSLL